MTREEVIAALEAMPPGAEVFYGIRDEGLLYEILEILYDSEGHTIELYSESYLMELRESSEVVKRT